MFCSDSRLRKYKHCPPLWLSLSHLPRHMQQGQAGRPPGRGLRPSSYAISTPWLLTGVFAPHNIPSPLSSEHPACLCILGTSPMTPCPHPQSCIFLWLRLEHIPCKVFFYAGFLRAPRKHPAHPWLHWTGCFWSVCGPRINLCPTRHHSDWGEVSAIGVNF